MKITVIHPEGNINNNPHLSGFVDLLCESGFDVQVISPFKPQIYQKQTNSKVHLNLIHSPDSGDDFISGFLQVNDIELLKLSGCDLIIGVDRGIIEASQLASHFQSKLALISYEIFFAAECTAGFKETEIQACRGIEFAIVQDKVRAQNLNVENQIPLEKMLYSPVAAPSWSSDFQKSDYLHKKFNIPHHKKIALFMGMVDFWSGITEMVDIFKGLGSEWELIVHNRYGMDARTNKFMQQIQCSNIHFSKIPFEDPKDLKILVQGADLGIAFYKPNFKSIYTGRNIAELGLASGKISSYLQYGTPILINEIGEMSRLVEDHNIGLVYNPQTLQMLNTIDTHGARTRAFKFFKQHLDLNRFFPAILNKINGLKVHVNDTPQIDYLKTGLEAYQNDDYILAISLFSQSEHSKDICNSNISFIHNKMALNDKI